MRDRLLEVQVNKPETGLLPTKVLHSEELEMTRTELTFIPRICDKYEAGDRSGIA